MSLLYDAVDVVFVTLLVAVVVNVANIDVIIFATVDFFGVNVVVVVAVVLLVTLLDVTNLMLLLLLLSLSLLHSCDCLSCC